MTEEIPDIFKEFYKRHDLISFRTSWHQQHLLERVLDLQGFISSISDNLEDERIDYDKSSYPLGFFEVEQPTRIRYVKIIFIFTILERRARALCKLIFELKKTEKTIDDYKGSFTNRLKSYIKEYLLIDFDQWTDWNDIIKLQKIRDCIIHCGGQVIESRDKEYIQKLIKDGEDFDISKPGYLYINQSFSGKIENTVIDFICTVLEVLYNALREVQKKQK